MANSAFYSVSESFIASLDGREVEYHQGEVVASDDPAVSRFSSHFKPLVVRSHGRADVEQATAAPGEKRGGKVA